MEFIYKSYRGHASCTGLQVHVDAVFLFLRLLLMKDFCKLVCLLTTIWCWGFGTPSSSSDALYPPPRGPTTCSKPSDLSIHSSLSYWFFSLLLSDEINSVRFINVSVRPLSSPSNQSWIIFIFFFRKDLDNCEIRDFENSCNILDSFW